MNYWCPTPSQQFNSTAETKMACGTWWHWYMQNKVLGPLGVLRGHWVNLESDVYNLENAWHPDPSHAILEAQHTTPRWQFYEEAMTDLSLRISGHHDGVVSIDRMNWLFDNLNLVRKDLPTALKEVQGVPEGVLALLELKTQSVAGAEKWQTAADTPDYYKMQACIYQRMSGHDTTMFLIADRDEFKPRMIRYEYEDKWWSEATSKATDIWTAIRDRVLPEGICSSKDFWRAKKCTFKKRCWSDETFEDWVQQQIDAQPDRKWLDLSKWEPSDT